MLYLIDGYNLLFRLFSKEKKIEDQRNLLITFFEEKASLLHIKITIIFDGHHQKNELSNRSYHDHIKVIYTPKDQTADDYILEKIFLSKNPSQITVVSSDRSLCIKAKQMKAEIKSIESFLTWLSIKEEKSHDEEFDEGEFIDTKANISRLHKIFEEKLKKEKD